MEQTHAIGFANFFAQTDTLARVMLLVMLVMSIATWYLIITKTLALMIERRKSARFLESFWNAPSLASYTRLAAVA